MKIPRLLFCGILLLFQRAQAQQVITVQGPLSAAFYSSLDSAMAYANDGDQVYIPGGIYNINSFNFNKSVFIFGAGHYPDSSLATGITYLTGDVFLVSGSAGGMITGCNISGNITVGNGTAGSDSVSNFTISRCTFNNLLFSSTGLPLTNARNFSVNENVILGGISGANAANINIAKNIITGGISYFNSTSFTNNDFIGFGDCVTMLNFAFKVSSCTFDNNIILYSPPACSGAGVFGDTCNSNVFTNNLFKYAMTFPQGTNTGVNSITNQLVSSTFVSAPGNVFLYSQDYHLKVTSPGYHGASDGNDIGIYGSAQPYKESAVPLNPHIQLKSINTSTDPQGLLNIHVRVAAQDY